VAGEASERPRPPAVEARLIPELPVVEPPVVEPPVVEVPAIEPPPPPRRQRLHRAIVVLGCIVVLVVAYEIFTSFVAYTDDAYVRSDLVAIAPEVTGRVLSVDGVDNQDVKVGDRLFTIDPEPFQLEVHQHQAQIEQDKALVAAAGDDLKAAEATLASATSAFTYAREMQVRFDVLARTQNAPRAELDKANDELRRAEAQMTVSRTRIAQAQSTITANDAALKRATAELAIAEWKLSRTVVTAPVAGSLVHLTLRVGDTAAADAPLIGIVDAAAYRIVANYKQDYVRSFTVGETAWVWLDTEPWHLHRARITGIARGISREKEEIKLLPYVAPTTDWIRLQRRIPVTMVLVDPPPGGRLFMGADARTVIFP
jgi:membrane fusion protein, multidrug efflux system